MSYNYYLNTYLALLPHEIQDLISDHVQVLFKKDLLLELKSELCPHKATYSESFIALSSWAPLAAAQYSVGSMSDASVTYKYNLYEKKLERIVNEYNFLNLIIHYYESWYKTMMQDYTTLAFCRVHPIYYPLFMMVKRVSNDYNKDAALTMVNFSKLDYQMKTEIFQYYIDQYKDALRLLTYQELIHFLQFIISNTL